MAHTIIMIVEFSDTLRTGTCGSERNLVRTRLYVLYDNHVSRNKGHSEQERAISVGRKCEVIKFQLTAATKLIIVNR